jgi:uncharacterized Fe-S radical SAM superfamily protein PflX
MVFIRYLDRGSLRRGCKPLKRCCLAARLPARLRQQPDGEPARALLLGRLPVVSSYTPHFGEEPALTGTQGAGNIFFGNCNLRCVYCQNYQISQAHKEQIKNEVTHERLAEMMLELQARGCHNINFVSPTHFAPQLARAVLIAAGRGLESPIVYNTNAYDSVEVLRLLEGVVGVYLPDLKYADSTEGYTYSKVPNYTEHARAALREMYRQTGDELVFAPDGTLRRGLVVRLLVLPNDVAGVRESLEWIRDELSPRVAVSLDGAVLRDEQGRDGRALHAALAPHLEREWWRAVSAARRTRDGGGLDAGVRRRLALLPPRLHRPREPFKDIRDFQT